MRRSCSATRCIFARLVMHQDLQTMANVRLHGTTQHRRSCRATLAGLLPGE